MKVMFNMMRWLISAGILALLVTGCAGSKETTSQDDIYADADDYNEIERLLGITPDDREEQTAGQENSGDEDLLDILQINQPEEDNSPSEPLVVNEPSMDDGNELGTMEDPEPEEQQPVVSPTRRNDTSTRPVVSSDQPVVSSTPPPVYRPTTTPSYGSGNYEQGYNDAYNLFQQRQYRDAISAFESLLATNTDHSLSDNCQYWIGEGYYMLGDYRAAILAFEKVFTYKQSNKNDYAQYKLGLCYFYLNERERAQQEFQSLLDNHKNSTLVDKAQQYMARL